MRWITACLCGLALLAAPADARMLTLTGGVAQPQQRWMERARTPAPHGDVVFGWMDCGDPAIPGTEAVTACAQPGIPPRVWVAAGPDSHHEFLHELGHVYDYTTMTRHARARFLKLRFMPGRAWRSPPDSPHEQFAEAYKFCAMPSYADREYDPSTGRVEGAYGFRPTWPQYERICTWLSGRS